MTMLARVWCRSLYVHVTCVRQGQRTTRGATSQATGFRGSPRAQRESRYSPSSKGVRGPSGLRPARPAVNIHSFIARNAKCKSPKIGGQPIRSLFTPFDATRVPILFSIPAVRRMVVASRIR